jgi:zinc D-Ala-D-Ala dipeptidase
MRSIRFAVTLCMLALLGSIEAAGAGLPRGFVDLADLDPSIRQDIRYASPHNFIGRPIAGYLAGECVLTQKAAQALKQVNAGLAGEKLALVVWDCYRPARAVSDFLAWTRAQDARMKAEFFPNTEKSQLFALGYLASRSAHSRGSTVDLGVVPSDVLRLPVFDPTAALQPCTAPKGVRFEDGAIDLGTGYDCLDPLAATANPRVARQALANRLLLKDRMIRAGFRPYWREWWHFELAAEPFPQQSFDFPIMARAPAATKPPDSGAELQQ